MRSLVGIIHQECVSILGVVRNNCLLTSLCRVMEYAYYAATSRVLFWGYLLLSSLARFVIEFVRINPPLAFGLSEAQMISLILMTIGAGEADATRTSSRRNKVVAENPASGTEKPQ